MTPLELSTGMILGSEPDRPGDPGPVADPVSALEDELRPALDRPPCLISFSGGRDSSVILSVATSLARREGLPEPIPITYRIDGIPEMEETEWQESVVSELRVNEWEVMRFSDELDVVGPFACEILLRHGVLFPFNAHGHVPLMRAAMGGSLVTGAGGDELFSLPSRARSLWVLHGQTSLQLRDPLRIAYGRLPLPIRQVVTQWRSPVRYRWLTPAARRSLARLRAQQTASQPDRWDESRMWWLRRKYVGALQETLELLAADEDVMVHNPFMAPAVVGAVAQAGGALGWRSRNEALQAIFEHHLPHSVAGRTSKATGNPVFFARHSREFTSAWQGGGLALDVVDLEGLREEWASSDPAAQTFTLVQAAWLSQQAVSEL